MKLICCKKKGVLILLSFKRLESQKYLVAGITDGRKELERDRWTKVIGHLKIRFLNFFYCRQDHFIRFFCLSSCVKRNRIKITTLLLSDYGNSLSTKGFE